MGPKPEQHDVLDVSACCHYHLSTQCHFTQQTTLVASVDLSACCTIKLFKPKPISIYLSC